MSWDKVGNISGPSADVAPLFLHPGETAPSEFTASPLPGVATLAQTPQNIYDKAVALGVGTHVWDLVTVTIRSQSGLTVSAHGAHTAHYRFLASGECRGHRIASDHGWADLWAPDRATQWQATSQVSSTARTGKLTFGHSDWTPQTGRVLTASDDSGNATWQDPAKELPATAQPGDTLTFDGTSWVASTNPIKTHSGPMPNIEDFASLSWSPTQMIDYVEALGDGFHYWPDDPYAPLLRAWTGIELGYDRAKRLRLSLPIGEWICEVADDTSGKSSGYVAVDQNYGVDRRLHVWNGTGWPDQPSAKFTALEAQVATLTAQLNEIKSK